MTIQTKTEAGDLSTLAARLQHARKAANMSRAELARRTGIPAKTIEKVEYGTQELTVSRLQSVCDEIGIDILWLITGEADSTDDDVTDEAMTPQDHPRPSGNARQTVQANSTAPLCHLTIADGFLSELEGMFEQGYEDCPRKALAYYDAAVSTMRFLDPVPLVELAKHRGMRRRNLPTADTLHNALLADIEAGEALCAAFAQRIADFHFFGEDLHDKDMSALQALAERLELRGGGFFGWESKEALIAALRPVLKQRVIAGETTVLSGETEEE
jgi:transcriptional regulator with XRE-family HTH domain